MSKRASIDFKITPVRKSKGAWKYKLSSALPEIFSSEITVCSKLFHSLNIGLNFKFLLATCAVIVKISGSFSSITSAPLINASAFTKLNWGKWRRRDWISILPIKLSNWCFSYFNEPTDKLINPLISLGIAKTLPSIIFCSLDVVPMSSIFIWLLSICTSVCKFPFPLR